MNKSAIVAALLANASAKSVTNVVKVEEIVQGIMMGALQTEGFTDIAHCIQDVETVVQDAEIAIKDFEKKSVTGVVDGLKEVAEIYKVVKQGMQDCTKSEVDWARFEKMISEFQNPRSFAYHVGKNLLVNGKDIYHEIDASIGDYKAQNWSDFGYEIGEASAKALLGKEKEQMAEFVQGLVKPYGGKFNLEALLVCVGDEDKALLVVDAAVQSVEDAIAKKDYVEIIPAAILLFAAYQQAMQGLPACEAIVSDADFQKAEFERSQDIIENPRKYMGILAEEFLTNGFDLMGNMEAAVADYKSGNMEAFGEEMGGLLKKLTSVESQKKLAKKNDSIDRRMTTEVAQGFLEATKVGTFNFTNLLICIYEADQSAEILYEGVEILEEAWADKDPMEAVGGVIAVVAFVQQLKQSIPVCEAVDAKSMNWTEYDKIVNTIWNPETKMSVLADDIMFNGQTISYDVREALELYKEGNYKAFGKKMGQTLETATNADSTLFLY